MLSKLDRMAAPSSTASRPDTRQHTRKVLLIAMYACALFVILVQVLTLVAGTWIVRDNNGTKRLALHSLAVVKFDGIIPSSTDPNSYALTMYFFANAFGYEYPASAVTTSPNVRLPSGFVDIGRDLGISRHAWGCLQGPWECESQFYQAFRFGSLKHSRGLQLFTVSYALSFTLLILGTELLIAVRPSWLRCYCYFTSLKRVCPCPRGSRAEIEALPSEFWDRYRLWSWSILPLCSFTAASVLVMDGMLLKVFVGRSRAENVNARFGTGFVAMQATCMGAAAIAIVLLCARRALGRKVNWMEQQGASPENGARNGGVRPKKYSD